MKTTVKERLIKYLSEKRITKSAFEKSIGLGKGYVNNISKGIGEERLQRISQTYPDLNIAWLATGEGEMLRTSQPSSTTSDHSVAVSNVNNSGTTTINNNTRLSMREEESIKALTERCELTLATATKLIETANNIMEHAMHMNDNMRQQIKEMHDVYNTWHRTKEEQLARSQQNVNEAVANNDELYKKIKELLEEQTKKTKIYLTNSTDEIIETCKTVEFPKGFGDYINILNNDNNDLRKMRKEA